MLQSQTEKTKIGEPRSASDKHTPTEPYRKPTPTEAAANREWYPYKGLCGSCVVMDECTYRRDRANPIHSCDEFEGAVMPPPAPTVLSQKRMNDRAKAANQQWYPGLCGICAKQADCVFPKPAGGVWQCEEYE